MLRHFSQLNALVRITLFTITQVIIIDWGCSPSRDPLLFALTALTGNCYCTCCTISTSSIGQSSCWAETLSEGKIELLTLQGKIEPEWFYLFRKLLFVFWKIQDQRGIELLPNNGASSSTKGKKGLLALPCLA